MIRTDKYNNKNWVLGFGVKEENDILIAFEYFMLSN